MVLLEKSPIDQTAYDKTYYLDANGVPQKTFDFTPNQTVPRAHAMAETVNITCGDKVLGTTCILLSKIEQSV
jgi:hypothetical protein